MEDDLIKTKTAGGVVINKDGKVLVVSQEGISWSLPKGHIEDGENAREAAEREIYEESGIRDLEFAKDLGSYERHEIGLDGGDDISKLKMIKMFLFRTKTIKSVSVDPKNPEIKWLGKDKVTGCLTHRKDKEFFESVKEQI